MTPADRAARHQALRQVAPYSENPAALSVLEAIVADREPVIIDACRATHMPARGVSYVLFGDRQHARLPAVMVARDIDQRHPDVLPRQSPDVEEAMVCAIEQAHPGRAVVFQQAEMAAAQARLRAKGER